MSPAIRSTTLLLVLALVAGQLAAQSAAKGQGPADVEAHLERSRELRASGDLNGSIEMAIKACHAAELAGHDRLLTESLLEAAQAHRAQGNLDHAISACIRASAVHGTYHSELRTRALVELAGLYLEAGFPRKTIEHLDEAQASTAADRMDRGRYDRLRVQAWSRVLEPEELVKRSQPIVEEAVRKGDRRLELEARSALASALASLERHAEALENEERVLELCIALDRPEEAGVSANNIGELRLRLGDLKGAQLAYGKGLIMVEDMPALSTGMQINAAHAHAKAGNLATAQRMLQEAAEKARRTGQQRYLPHLHRTEAALAVLQGDLRLAQQRALAAEQASLELADDRELTLSYDLLAEIFTRRHLTDEARTYEQQARKAEKRVAEQALEARAARDAHLLRLQRLERDRTDQANRERNKDSRLKQLALDAENREKRIALLTYEKELQESERREALLEKEQLDKELQLTRARLEAEQQDRMISDLEAKRMLQSLSLTKLELQRQEQDKNLELLAERNAATAAQKEALEARRDHDLAVKRFSIGLASLALLLAVYLFWAWTNMRRKKRIIAEQNAHISGINVELSEKNEDIRASLNYAQTIQAAILPSEEDLRRHLPESFLLYRPLDIVSGDLPFVRECGDRLYVGAIDCTGHGVPAAMMTFIAYYAMNDLLTEHGQLPCGRLLDLLHDRVKDTMTARGEQHLFNAGFDIGLCSIDLKRGDLCFAGAQLPLVHVRDGEVQRLKGDILPLGDAELPRRQGYRSHSLQLRDGDAIFLYSDGIIHQLGGPERRKKFSTRKLTELLHRATQEDLASLKESTESAFEDWRGDEPQTDDVLLIGIKYAA